MPKPSTLFPKQFKDSFTEIQGLFEAGLKFKACTGTLLLMPNCLGFDK